MAMQRRRRDKYETTAGVKEQQLKFGLINLVKGPLN
jgi:hypothetical protein